MEKNCRELTKVYVYRKLSGGEAMHLNLFSGNDSYFNRKIFEKQALGKRINRLDIKHPEKQQKKIQLIALRSVESTETLSPRFVELLVEFPERGID